MKHFSILFLGIILLTSLSISPNESFSQTDDPWVEVMQTLGQFGFGMENSTTERVKQAVEKFNELDKQEDELYQEFEIGGLTKEQEKELRKRVKNESVSKN